MDSLLRKIIYGGGVFFDLFKWIFLVVVIFSLIIAFWISIFVVDGISMDPTFRNGEIVILNKNVYVKNDPKRGDVVVVRYPGDPENKKYVKRVVGLPGETLMIDQGRVYINSRVLRESYIRYDVISEPSGTWVLKPGEYFLMGDNRPMSNDSRYFGPVEKRFFYGQAIVIIFPRINSYFN